MRLILILLVCAAAVEITIAGERPIRIDLDEPGGRAEISFKGKRVLVYSFERSQFKPYVRELYTVGGENLLLDGPSDHLHHHGLMYAIRVNGINFWEETAESGRQKHISISQKMDLQPGASASAELIHLVHWVPPERETPLLMERRVLSVSVNEKAAEVAVQWKASFTVGEERVKLHGSAYNGLGLRLPPSWSVTAIHRNSEALPYTPEHKWDVTPGRWAAVSRGNESAILLFGCARNSGETRFFSMVNPFTYLSATQNLEFEPLSYGKGEKFDLSYLVLAYSSGKSSQFIESRYTEWLKREKTQGQQQHKGP